MIFLEGTEELTMKTLLVLSLGLMVVGCGEGELRDCDAACNRRFKCCADIICDGPPYTMEDCMSMCESANKVTNADTLKAYNKCSGIPCEEHDKLEECITQASARSMDIQQLINVMKWWDCILDASIREP
jgi:hypothetical protein